MDNNREIIDELDIKIIKLETKMEELNKKIDIIISNFLDLKKINERMDNHITFIERIYETVKYPLYILSNSSKYFTFYENPLRKKITLQNLEK